MIRESLLYVAAVWLLLFDFYPFEKCNECVAKGRKKIAVKEKGKKRTDVLMGIYIYTREP